MNQINLLLDVAVIPGGSTTGIVLAVVFFLIFLAIAFVSFKMLQKTVKMAIRMVIVAIILLIAIVGGISLLLFSSNSSSGGKPPRPPVSEPKR